MNAPEQQKLIGAAVKRKEDYRFLTGAGQYTDDVVMPQQSYGVFLRSPHAHAKISSIDIDAAKTVAGRGRAFSPARTWRPRTSAACRAAG